MIIIELIFEKYKCKFKILYKFVYKRKYIISNGKKCLYKRNKSIIFLWNFLYFINYS